MHTFLWHDYETFGANVRRDRPAQFAAIRTDADLREIGVAARKLANHAFVLGGGLGFGTSFLKWLAFLAAV